MLQDHLVPYMLDTRHIPDTLFIVLEEDFRLYPTEGEPVASDVGISRGAEFLGDGIGGGGAGGEPVASPDPTASQVPTVKAQWHARLGVPPDGQKAASHTRPKGKAAPAPTFLTRPVKASADEHKYNTSKELEDLVKLVTAAKRCDVGDIVWFGWNEQPGASQVKSPSPSFGSTGIAVSVEGAKKIKYALPTMQMWHWDVELLKKLQQGDMKASFVFPAIGNFASQQSGILKGAKERKSEWGSWWNQPGVAPYLDEHVNRQLWKWNGPKRNISNTEKVATVLLMDEGVRQSLDWKTYFRRDPDTFQEPDALDKKGGPPPPPLTQDQMQAMCDMTRLVKPIDYGSQTREHRGARHMKSLARRRMFTESVQEVAGVQKFFLITQNVCVCFVHCNRHE